MEEIDRKVNKSAILKDGQKIYIPFVGEKLADSKIVNINSSSQYELESLPGVGPVTAKKIIDGRPYASAEELYVKKVMSKSAFEKVSDLVDF